MIFARACFVECIYYRDLYYIVARGEDDVVAEVSCSIYGNHMLVYSERLCFGCVAFNREACLCNSAAVWSDRHREVGTKDRISAVVVYKAEDC